MIEKVKIVFVNALNKVQRYYALPQGQALQQRNLEDV